jgi:hypothetical protein
MEEPTWLRRFAAVKAFAVEPGAQAVAAFDSKVIACQRLAGVVALPLHGDALGSLSDLIVFRTMPVASALVLAAGG